MGFLFSGKLSKKISTVLFSGALLVGFCSAAENAKVKELVGAKYYETLIKKGVVSEYRDDGSKGFRLLPETVYSSKINESMITKENKNYPYTFEGLYLLNKKELLAKSGS